MLLLRSARLAPAGIRIDHAGEHIEDRAGHPHNAALAEHIGGMPEGCASREMAAGRPGCDVWPSGGRGSPCGWNDSQDELLDLRQAT